MSATAEIMPTLDIAVKTPKPISEWTSDDCFL